MRDPNDSDDGTDWDDEPERVDYDSEWTEQQELWGGRPVYDRNGCPANQRRDGTQGSTALLALSTPPASTTSTTTTMTTTDA